MERSALRGSCQAVSALEGRRRFARLRGLGLARVHDPTVPLRFTVGSVSAPSRSEKASLWFPKISARMQVTIDRGQTNDRGRRQPSRGLTMAGAVRQTRKVVFAEY